MNISEIGRVVIQSNGTNYEVMVYMKQLDKVDGKPLLYWGKIPSEPEGLIDEFIEKIERFGDDIIKSN